MTHVKSDDRSQAPDREPRPPDSQSPDSSRWPDRRFSILGDVLGPEGHGPSSSHTIAPQRAAHEAQQMLGGQPDSAEVWLLNSMATTGEGHGTHIATAAGLLGLDPTDPQTREALGLAQQVGTHLTFHKVPTAEDEHPNAIYLQLNRGELSLDVKIVSIGGGNYELECDTAPSVEASATTMEVCA